MMAGSSKKSFNGVFIMDYKAMLNVPNPTEKIIKLKIYVRPNSWNAYMTAFDEQGEKITISIDPKKFIKELQDTSWQEYRDEHLEQNANVQVFHL